MQSVELSVTIPVTTNDGDRQPDITLQWVKHYLLAFAGGATVGPEQTGLWIGPDGTLYQDIVQVWTMYVDSAKAQEFDALASTLAQRLDQEAILYTVREIQTHFVYKAA